MHRFLTLFLAALIATALSPGAKRVQDVYDRLEQAEKLRKPVTFSVTESDLNDYLVYSLTEEPRPAVQSIRVQFQPENRVISETLLDLDDIERARPGTIPGFLRFLFKGKRRIAVDLQFTAVNAQLTFTVKQAKINGVDVPPRVVERIIQVAAAQQPERYDTSKPMRLPHGLKTVWTGAGTLHGTN
jgi:hypothetical protein